MSYDKVLVTGGAGFIGSHVVDALLNGGAKVWILDNLSTGTPRNLRAWRRNSKLNFRKGSVVQSNVVATLAKKVDAIVHLAAQVSPYVSVKKPEVVNAINVSGTLTVLNAALKAEVQRVVFASSSSVYGNQTLLPIAEDNPLHPVTPYGVSKLAGEKYCGAYFQTYGLNTVALRYFNVFGERQSANPYSGVIAIFAKQFTKGLRPTIYGDGTQTRDFIHVSDVVRANLQALESSKGIGDAFNVGTGRSTSINELASLVAELVGRPEVSTTHSANRTGDIRHSYANMTRAKEVLGFQPRVELKEGLKQLIDSTAPRSNH